MPTARVAQPRLCASLVVGGPQGLSGPPGGCDGSTNAVCGPWEGGGGPESRSLVPAKPADPFWLQVAYASYKHGRGRLGSIRSSSSPSKGLFWQKRAAEGGMRGQRRISTGGAVDGLRGALDVSQLVANDVARKRNETSLNNVTNNSLSTMLHGSEHHDNAHNQLLLQRAAGYDAVLRLHLCPWRALAMARPGRTVLLLRLDSNS